MISKERFYQSVFGRCVIILYGLLVLLFDTLTIKTNQNKLLSQNIRKTLLLVKVDAIGDFILWLPSAHAFRKLYPVNEWEITLLANQNWADLARRLAIFDNVYALDNRKFHQNWAYRFKTLIWVVNQHFQIAINAVFSREFLSGDALIRASQAQQRIGQKGDSFNQLVWLKQISDRWYTQLKPDDGKAKTELKRNAELVDYLGSHEAFALPKLSTSDFSSDLIPKKPYFVLFPGASWTGRQWPTANFSEISMKISRQTGWHAVVCGGSGDVESASELESECKLGLTNLAGKTDLHQLAALLAGSELVLTNETSAAHIGPAVGTMTICIAGGGHYGRFVPYDSELNPEKLIVVNHNMPCYGCNWNCIYPYENNSPMPCMTGVSVDQVWQAVSRVLDRIEAL